MKAHTRWLLAVAGALIAALVLVVAVWALDRARASPLIKACLDRGDTWDYDARVCQTN